MINKSVPIPDCPCCKHFRGHAKLDQPLRCGAFPDGIPNEYLFGSVFVRELPKCGNGYHYEEIEALSERPE